MSMLQINESDRWRYFEKKEKIGHFGEEQHPQKRNKTTSLPCLGLHGDTKGRSAIYKPDPILLG